MFEQTVSFWRRLLHPRDKRNTAGETAQEERRGSRRFRVQRPILYELAGGSGPGALTAHMRNISVGGINLLVEQNYRPGDLLSIHLPASADEAPTTVLACVVHVTPLDGDCWALGCTFARELSEQDLQSFCGSADPEPHTDQRSYPRYTCDIQARYQVVSAPALPAQPALVLNISNTGVGLLVRRCIEVGSLLTMELAAANHPVPLTILSCVVHVTELPEEEWALGCNFITEISEIDLKSLLQHKPV